MTLLRHCIRKEIENPTMNIGRLLLLQCPRKIKKYGGKYPQFKTTRPISVTGVYQKILEHILLNRIKQSVIHITSNDNAGFKPKMSCQMQLQRIMMQLEINMKQNKPSFIIAQDVKSGYNNIRWKDVLKNCK